MLPFLFRVLNFVNAISPFQWKKPSVVHGQKTLARNNDDGWLSVVISQLFRRPVNHKCVTKGLSHDSQPPPCVCFVESIQLFFDPQLNWMDVNKRAAATKSSHYPYVECAGHRQLRLDSLGADSDWSLISVLDGNFIRAKRKQSQIMGRFSSFMAKEENLPIFQAFRGRK